MAQTNFSGPVQSSAGFKVGSTTVIDSNGNIDAPITTTTLTASGTTTLSGAVIEDATTASSGAAAVPVTGRIHEITTTGTGDALTLADGTEGQMLTLVYVAEGAGGDTAVLTPSNLAGGTTITFNALGDAANLIFTAGAWYFLGGAAVVA